ncbi:MAG: DUF6120 family protein [Eubacteriales bacterium]|nr:DUF6120 family protein [Eubacteriales bacterium]
MEKRNREARRYLRAIRGWLPCAGKMKGQMLGNIQSSLDEFLSEKPDADYQALVDRFGTPQQIASTYVDEAETGELLRLLRVRRKVVSIISAVAAALVLTWAAYVTIELVCDAYDAQTSYVNVTITEVERTPLD